MPKTAVGLFENPGAVSDRAAGQAKIEGESDVEATKGDASKRTHRMATCGGTWVQ